MKLQVQQLWKAYSNRPVLRDVSFSVTEGETLAIMAPSGTGKTTLLRILLGLERPDRGELSGLDQLRFSAVFQEDRLLEHLSAEGNLKFAAGPYYQADAAQALLQELGLDWSSQRVREYSGGMKRRLSLARALLVPFDVLTLDEPFTGLDPDNRTLALQCIQRHTAGKIVLLVTHDAGDVQTLSAKILSLT